jgi:hypothetical protein
VIVIKTKSQFLLLSDSPNSLFGMQSKQDGRTAKRDACPDGYF